MSRHCKSVAKRCAKPIPKALRKAINEPRPNKRVTPRAASFKRIAKALRVRAKNHNAIAKRWSGSSPCSTGDCIKKHEETLADVYTGIAAELDNEARTLRAQR